MADQLAFREVADDERYRVTDINAGGFTFSITALHDGKSTRGHDHPWPEVYVGLKGRGTLFLGSEPQLNVAVLGRTAPVDHWIQPEGETMPDLSEYSDQLRLLQNATGVEISLLPGSRFVIPSGIHHRVYAHTEMEFACFFIGER